MDQNPLWPPKAWLIISCPPHPNKLKNLFSLNSHVLKLIWLVLPLHLMPLPKNHYLYLALIAAEDTGEGIEPGVQVGNGRSWVEQCFHCKGMGKGLSSYHLKILV